MRKDFRKDMNIKLQRGLPTLSSDSEI
jgi:hypothetical protein